MTKEKEKALLLAAREETLRILAHLRAQERGEIKEAFTSIKGPK